VKPLSVDAYVNTRVPAKFRPIVAKIRAFMKEYATKAPEIMSYGMPCYRARYIVAYIVPNQKGITFGFVRGKQMKDEYGLLQGTAKSSRYLRFRSPADVKVTILRYYVRQALALDGK